MFRTFRRTTANICNMSRIKLASHEPCNKIVDGLFLGMIPTKEGLISEVTDLDEKIKEYIGNSDETRPLKAVISVVEKDELNGDGFLWTKMVSPEDWTNNHEVEHHMLEMRDHTANVSKRSAIETIDLMRDVIKRQHGSVFVHCKSGVGRSVMMAAIYLACYEVDPETKERVTLDAAFKCIEKIRKRISVNGKKEIAYELIDLIKKRDGLIDRIRNDTYEPLSSMINSYDRDQRGDLLSVLPVKLILTKLSDIEELKNILNVLPSPGWKAYFINMIGWDDLKIIVGEDNFIKINLDYMAWKGTHLIELATLCRNMIQHPVWNKEGKMFYGLDIPDGIRAMRKCQLSGDLNANTAMQYIESIASACPSDISATRSKLTEKIYYLIHAVIKDIKLYNNAAALEADLDQLKSKFAAVTDKVNGSEMSQAVQRNV